MIILRQYQQDAVSSVFEYFEHNNGNPLIVMPTGSGKAIVQAAFIRETLARWPQERFLLLTHVKELIRQNTDKIETMNPGVSVGVYSAGLGRRDLGYQITVAGIQSAHRRAHEFGDISIVIIDEAHLVSKNESTMYRRFLDRLKEFCPSLKVVGMSATPFRLDSGSLIKGEHRIFTDFCYQITIKELIDQGFLCTLETAKTKVRADTKGVKKQGGDFVVGDLERAVDLDPLTQAALTETEALAYDRKSWLVFCVGVKHAEHVRDAIRARGHVAELVIGSTPKELRDRYVEDFKARKIRALISVGVLTTGFDAPCADALICLRPTCSPGLWVQMVGRITRLYPEKASGLVLDFTSNTRNHGPVDLITMDGSGEPKPCPMKICKKCEHENMPSAKKCEECGSVFGRVCKHCGEIFSSDKTECPGCGTEYETKPREIKHNTNASCEDILSTYEVNEKKVSGWSWYRHKKKDKPDSIRVDYQSADVIGQTWSDWLCFDHQGYAQLKALGWWYRNGGKRPGPLTVDEALSRKLETTCPSEIRVKRDGKWWRVIT